MKRLSFWLICFIFIACLTPNIPVQAAPVFNLGDKVQIINSLSVGLAVRDAPAGNTIKARKYDGTSGTILDGPTNAVLPSDGRLYTWWKVRWGNDGVEGWSAGFFPEMGGVDYLQKQTKPVSTKFIVGQKVRVVNMGSNNYHVRTTPPGLSLQDVSKHEGDTGTIILDSNWSSATYYGVPDLSLGAPLYKGPNNDYFYHFWCIHWDAGGQIGWSAEAATDGDYLVAFGNQLPVAVIDSIIPNPATFNLDRVTFTGHGTSINEPIIAYSWRSSIDGELGATQTLEKQSGQVSVGVHTIYFKVQDNSGLWSEETTSQLTITPKGTQEVKFRGIVTATVPNIPVWGYFLAVRITDVLSDPTGELYQDATVFLMSYASVMSLEVGEAVEVFGVYEGKCDQPIPAFKVLREDSSRHYIVSIAILPVANFDAAPTQGIKPLSVQFTDDSTGDIYSWSWSFGDDGTSTEQNPLHVYNDAGIYTVSLTVSGWPGFGTNTATKNNYVIVNLPPTLPNIRTPISSVDFNNVLVGNSQDKTTTIYNDGPASLIINSITWDSGSSEFSYVSPSTPFNIGEGGSQAVTIRFSPGSTGTKSATFTVNSNDPDEASVSFSVSGTGAAVPTSNVNGIDVSHWQGTINWSQVYNAGYRFAFVKASSGDSEPPQIIDDQFDQNMVGGHNAGILMGAYHFAYPEYNSATAEAQFFVSVVGDYMTEGYLRPVLDLEDDVDSNSYPSRMGKTALSAWVNEFMITVQNLTGVEPLLYVNSNYANNYLDDSTNQYDLWIAHWTYNPNTSPNTGIWTNWDFWQYSDQGSIAGISGNVDLDLFKGDISRLNTFLISSPHSSPYKLPFPTDMSYECTQGNNQGTHTEKGAWAFDFWMPIGKTVVASRGGTVSKIQQGFGPGGNDPSYSNSVNYVVIDHGDGTSALYLHLKQDGVIVSIGQVILQGQAIAYSGNSGYVTGPHLHFQVQQTGISWWTQSIAIIFDDGGVPILDNQYISTNMPPNCHVGDYVITTVDGVHVRTIPSTTDNNPIWTAPNGTRGVITDGPQNGSGYTWWKVRYDSGYEGWSVRNWLSIVGITDNTRIIGLNGDMNFPGVQVNTTLTRTLTITNTGNSNLNVSSISYPSGFSGNWNNGSISANGGSKAVTVTFAPTSATTYGGTITVNSDKTDGTNTITCSGTTLIQKEVERPLVSTLAYPKPYVKAKVSYSKVDDTTYEVSEVRFSSEGVSSGLIEFGIFPHEMYLPPLPPLPGTAIWKTTFFTQGEERVFPLSLTVDQDDVMSLSFAGFADGTFHFGTIPALQLLQLAADLIRNAVPVNTTFIPGAPVSEGASQGLKSELAKLGSPGELRVYDSQNRVTGLVNGEVKEEIPNSIYYEQNEIVVIYSTSDRYRYEIVGTDEGTYGLDIAFIENGEAASFAATETHITTGAKYEYTIDWDAISQGEKGVTINKDSDGDGQFEETITTTPPYTASEPSPSSGAAGVSLSTPLSWKGGDPDQGDNVTYKIYLGTSQNIPLVSDNQTGNTYAPTNLKYDTNYYWKVVARDNHGITTEGPIWSFTTISPPAPSSSGSGGGGGGGGGVVGEKRITSIFSITTKMFKLGEDVEALSYDDKVKVFLKMGTEVKNAQGSFVTSIVIEKLASAPSAPTNAEIIGSVYDIGPSGATFNPPITITFSYDTNNLPEGVSEQSLAIAWFDKTASEWKVLEDSVVDTSKHTATAYVSHFTPYAIVHHQKPAPPAPTAPSPAPVPSAPTPPLPTPTPTPAATPAGFTVSNLSVIPSVVVPGEQVTISAIVTNTGGCEGCYNAILKINGEEEAKKDVTVTAGKSETVTFTVAKDTLGSYTININGRLGQFRVALLPPLPESTGALPFQPSTNWWLFGGIIAACVVVVGLSVYFLVWRRRDV